LLTNSGFFIILCFDVTGTIYSVSVAVVLCWNWYCIHHNTYMADANL